MNPIARQKLIELVERFGSDICDDPRRCEALLRDLCGDKHQREVFVLVAAVKNRAASELAADASGVPVEVLVAKLSARLHNNLGITEDLARWSVESWAVALGKLAGVPKTPVRAGIPESDEVLVPALASPNLSVGRAEQASAYIKEYKGSLQHAISNGAIKQRKGKLQDLTTQAQERLADIFSGSAVPKQVMDQVTTASEKATAELEELIAAQIKESAAGLEAHFKARLSGVERDSLTDSSPLVRTKLDAARKDITEILTNTLQQLRSLYGADIPQATQTRLAASSQSVTERVEALLAECEKAEQEVSAILPERLIHDYEQVAKRLQKIQQRFPYIDCRQLENSLNKFSDGVKRFEQNAGTPIALPVGLKWLRERQADIKRNATDCRNLLNELFGKDKVPPALLARCDDADQKASAQLESLIKQHEAMEKEAGNDLAQRVQAAGDFEGVRRRLDEIRKLFSDIDCSQPEALLAKLDSPEQQLIRYGVAHIRSQNLSFDEARAKHLLAQNDWKFLKEEFDGRVAQLRELIRGSGASSTKPGTQDAPIQQSSRWRRMNCDAEWKYWDAVALVTFDPRVFLTSSEAARAQRARAFKILAYGIICLCLAIAISTTVYHRLQTRKASSEYTLGLAYENGTGVKQDNGEALKLYRKAAERGDADSQYSSGTNGMVLIPGGSFTMGNSIGDEDITGAAPVVANVSAFYMDANLVTWRQWQGVYAYATNYGYGFMSAGAGKGLNHPVQSVSWFDCVKWCNARSQQAGKTPVYYTDAGLTKVYTNGEEDVYVNWGAAGYRLPTEAEWEKAARGGMSGQRFPWGNLISQTNANYVGHTSDCSYDLGPNGCNSIGSIGGTSPATSPVGSFVANGYGLNDMAGNVWQWCWDWYGTPYAGGTDPRGVATGSNRVHRGGSWGDNAHGCRAAARHGNDPGLRYYGIGFRSALPTGQ